MSKRGWYWVIGLSLVTLIACGGLVALGLWASNNADTDGGPAFGDAVAIVRVEGVILPGEAPPPNPFSGDTGGAYSQTVIDHLEQANGDDDVKAIILAVDSPGGSVYASDEIAIKINEIDKPIITAMGSLAASGGYYVAAPTDEIWAAKSTLTCSIGVISQFLNVEEFAEEYGVTTVTIKSGEFKDLGNPFDEFSQAERELWQSIIDDLYEEFLEVVVDGRDNMTEEEIRAMADGRVCSGQQAYDAGLVDSLGYLPDAIDRAAELGEIDGEPRIIEYGAEPDFFAALGASMDQPTPVEEMKEILNVHSGSPWMYLYTTP